MLAGVSGFCSFHAQRGLLRLQQKMKHEMAVMRKTGEDLADARQSLARKRARPSLTIEGETVLPQALARPCYGCGNQRQELDLNRLCRVCSGDYEAAQRFFPGGKCSLYEWLLWRSAPARQSA